MVIISEDEEDNSPPQYPLDQTKYIIDLTQDEIEKEGKENSMMNASPAIILLHNLRQQVCNVPCSHYVVLGS